ncbi:UNVERIFIED_CONTAM: transporter, major facilitator family protein [Hammondia hammondi]|eukprot:XP_008883138.1 transporter, major facilitator family protein [Hammondia hammondi]
MEIYAPESLAPRPVHLFTSVPSQRASPPSGRMQSPALQAAFPPSLGAPDTRSKSPFTRERVSSQNTWRTPDTLSPGFIAASRLNSKDLGVQAASSLHLARNVDLPSDPENLQNDASRLTFFPAANDQADRRKLPLEVVYLAQEPHSELHAKEARIQPRILNPSSAQNNASLGCTYIPRVPGLGRHGEPAINRAADAQPHAQVPQFADAEWSYLQESSADPCVSHPNAPRTGLRSCLSQARLPRQDAAPVSLQEELCLASPGLWKPLLSGAGREESKASPEALTDAEKPEKALVSVGGHAGVAVSPSGTASAGETTGRYFPLVCMLLMSSLCNFDHGVIPAVLGELQEHFPQMAFLEQSLLGSLVYFGLVVGTMFAGVSYQHLGAKWLLVASLGCLSAGLYVFSSSSSLTVMYFTRFCIGLCQALPVVYIPVWVDAFAPEGQVTRWMAFTQLGGIGGTVLGYFLGGVLSRLQDAKFFILAATSWRTPFVIQSIALLPLICALACASPKVVNLPAASFARPDPEREGGLPLRGDETRGQPSALGSVWRVLRTSLKGVKSLLMNRLYVITTLGMSTLYFVVTGIQFWVTEYMVVVLKFGKINVVVLSTLCFLTAPTSGIWCGGYICDQCGGYRGGQQRMAVRVATAFAGLAALQAVACVYVSDIYRFACLLWGSLFAGAALVPVAIGMILSSVPVHHRSLSSAVSQFAYHIFGWFAAPLASGAVMDFVDTWQAQQTAFPVSKELPLEVGFSMILCVSVLGFAFFAVANLLTLPSEEIAKEELELQLARSRLPTFSF